jgi:hypothetical protein
MNSPTKNGRHVCRIRPVALPVCWLTRGRRSNRRSGRPWRRGAVVEVRPPNQDPQKGGPFAAALGDEIYVDVQSADKFFQYLINRQILVDPRYGNPAEREADKAEEERIRNLPGAERGLEVSSHLIGFLVWSSLCGKRPTVLGAWCYYFAFTMPGGFHEGGHDS